MGFFWVGFFWVGFFGWVFLVGFLIANPGSRRRRRMTETCPSTTSGATRRRGEERTRTERERGRRARRGRRRSLGPGPVLGKITGALLLIDVID